VSTLASESSFSGSSKRAVKLDNHQRAHKHTDSDEKRAVGKEEFVRKRESEQARDSASELDGGERREELSLDGGCCGTRDRGSDFSFDFDN